MLAGNSEPLDQDCRAVPDQVTNGPNGGAKLTR